MWSRSRPRWTVCASKCSTSNRTNGFLKKPIETINVGFGNIIAVQRIVAVTAAGSSPLKRLVDGAEREHRLIDATSGRRTRSIIVTDSNHVILSHVNPATIAQKLEGGDVREDSDDEGL